MRISLVFLLLSLKLSSNPTDPIVMAGQAEFSQRADCLQISSSDRAIIHWKDFSIQSGEIVQFMQPGADSVVLNRVCEANPSQILGRLEANGKVLLINPHGIIVGKEASIHTGSLIASTFDIHDRAFLDGDEFIFSGSSTEAITNQGSIESSGDLLFIASNIDNQGRLSANGMAGCLAPRGNVLVKLSGYDRIYMRAADVSQLIQPDTWINHSGEISSPEVYLMGDYVALKENSKIDASGGMGGGQIFIGGGIRGQNPTFLNAKRLFVCPGSQLIADAVQGDGGTVVLWSNEATLFHGAISARGKRGGFAEVSGSYLEYKGIADLTGTEGTFGELLLDPADILITTAATSTTVAIANPTSWTAAAAPNSPIQINNIDLQNQLAIANVTIDTSQPPGFAFNLGDITVQDAVTWPQNTTLTLQASNNIVINNSITSTSGLAPPGIRLNFIAGNAITMGFAGQAAAINVTTVNGGIVLRGRDITIGHTAAAANGQCIVDALDAINGTMTITATNGLVVQSSPLVPSTNANVLVRSEANMTINARTFLLLGGADMTSTAIVESRTNGSQSVFTDLLLLKGNPGVAGIPILRSLNDQLLSIKGPIVVNNGTIRCQTNQTVLANSITISPGSIGISGAGGTQLWRISGNVLLQGIYDPGTMTSGSAQVTTTSLNALIGGNLDVLGYPGTSITEAAPASFFSGVNCSITVGGNVQVIAGSGGTQSILWVRANSTFAVGGKVLVDAPSPFAIPFFTNAEIWVYDPRITLRVSGNVTVGTPTSIGFSRLTYGENFQGSIGGDLLIQGGISNFASVGQVLFTYSTFPHSSPSSLIVGNDLIITGGSGSPSFASMVTYGPMTIQVGRDCIFTAGSGTQSEAYWFAIPDVFLSPFSIAEQNLIVGRDLILQGGSAPGGSAPAFILASDATQTVSVAGNIQLLAGTGAANNHALIGSGWIAMDPVFPFNFQDTTSSTVQAGGNIFMQNNASGSSAYFDCKASGIQVESNFMFPLFPLATNIGSMTIYAKGDITFSTSLDATEAPAPFDSLIHPILIDADHGFAIGDLWPGDPDPFLSATPLASPSGAVAKTGVGGFQVDTAPFGNGIQFTTQRGALYVSSAERFASLAIFDNLTIGPTAVNNNLTLNSISGDITVDPFHDITITNGVTTAGNVFIIAQNNIVMTASGFITAGGTVELVTDNQAPIVPLMGSGGFHMNAGSSITSGSTIRIFTALPAQNSISGSLNGSFLQTSLFLTDSNEEVWCSYFPLPIQGVPFTVFYKVCLQELTQEANVIDAQLLVGLHPYNEHPGWSETFSIKVIEENQLLYQMNFEFWRRHLSLLNQPKAWTINLHEGRIREAD